MKLVEILARDLVEWPERVKALEQMAMGEIIEAGNCAKVFCVTEKADFPEIVTRTQWQAERDRMKAMGTQQATASTEPTCEQQLWNRPIGSHQVGHPDSRGKAANKPTLSKREANATPIKFRDELIALAIHSRSDQ